MGKFLKGEREPVSFHQPREKPGQLVKIERTLGAKGRSPFDPQGAVECETPFPHGKGALVKIDFPVFKIDAGFSDKVDVFFLSGEFKGGQIGCYFGVDGGGKTVDDV